MQLLGGLKEKITGIYGKAKGAGESLINSEQNLDYEDMKHTLNVLKDENRILKNKIRLLEDSVLGDSQTNSSTQFGKIFKDLKSTFSFSSGQQVDSSWEFKKFLCDNLLFYNNIDEDDIDYLNSVQVSEEDWEKNKDLFIFKQKILEKNYSEMFKNILVSKELDEQINKYKTVQPEGNVSGSSIKDINIISENISKSSEVKTHDNGDITNNNNSVTTRTSLNMNSSKIAPSSAKNQNNIFSGSQNISAQKKKNENIITALEEKLLDTNKNQIKEQLNSPLNIEKINEGMNKVNKEIKGAELIHKFEEEEDEIIDFTFLKKENTAKVRQNLNENTNSVSSNKVFTKTPDQNNFSDLLPKNEQNSNQKKPFEDATYKISSIFQTQSTTTNSNLPTGDVTTVKIILPNKKKEEPDLNILSSKYLSNLGLLLSNDDSKKTDNAITADIFLKKNSIVNSSEKLVTPDQQSKKNIKYAWDEEEDELEDLEDHGDYK